MKRSSQTRALVLAVVLSGAPWLSADVIVVDGQGGGDFTSVSDAVSAALDGDIVLIRPGDYSLGGPGLPFPPVHAVLISGKSLTVVGDVGGPVIVSDVGVTDLPAGGTVLLRNLTIVPRSFIATSSGPTLGIHDCVGAVVVQDCNARGLDGYYIEQLFSVLPLPGLTALTVSSSPAVSFHRSQLTGGDGASSIDSPNQLTISTLAGRAASVTMASEVAFYDCLLTGGTGGTGLLSVEPGDPFENLGGSRGGDGLALFTGSKATLVGTLAQGGPGGDGCSTNQASACTGGEGVSASLSSFWDLDVELLGGAGGTLDDNAGFGANGLDVELFMSSRTSFSGQSVGLVKISPLRTGELGNVTVTGPAGNLFALFFGFEAGFLPLFHFKGAFIPGFPIQGPFLLSVMPPSGVFSAGYFAPEIAPFGLEGLITVDQVLMDQGPDGVILSAASSHIQVDTGF